MPLFFALYCNLITIPTTDEPLSSNKKLDRGLCLNPQKTFFLKKLRKNKPLKSKI